MSVNGLNSIQPDAPPTIKFVDATKHLAKSYYPYIYVDKRRLAKSIVDLQAAFEVCTDSLEEFDRLTTEINSINYAIFGLEQGLYRTVNELVIIRDEINELMTTLKENETFNLMLLNELQSIQQHMREGINSANATLKKTKTIKSSINLSPDNYMIPNSTKTALATALLGPEPSVKANSGMEGIIQANVPIDNKRLNWLIGVQRELSNRHSEFSFMLIGLWTETIYNNSLVETKEEGSGGCFSLFKVPQQYGRPDNKPLFLAQKAKGDETGVALNTVQGKLREVGGRIYEELGKLRTMRDQLQAQQLELNAEASQRRQQLVESLLATHSAIQTLLEMDEKNDALVGKLVKTRPLFDELHDAIVNDDFKEITSESKPILSQILGPDGWRHLMDSIGNLKVHLPQSEENQNAYLEQSELSTCANNQGKSKGSISLMLGHIRRKVHL